MKQSRRNTHIIGTIYGFILFFATIMIASTSSILVFDLVTKHTDNSVLIFFAVVGIVTFCAGVCTICDVFRRAHMVQKPVNKILDATKKIASGDFSVKLVSTHDFTKFDEYDLIFDNINTMTAELSKNQLLSNDFISNVSHEIKTPLSVIQNYAKALQKGNLNATKQKEYLDGLVLQTNKLSSLITNILKLNKLENQQIVPEIEEIDLSEVLRVSILSFEQLLEEKQIELSCDIDDVKVVSSATLLELVFNNLISNAIKFTENNGNVEISLKEQGKQVVIKVKDTGCGISSEVGKHIFDKFYQGDTSHTKEGNGLGLALVKKVIDLIGGEISVESKIGVGSTFIIKINKE